MTPVVHDHPIRRPGFIKAARWIGPDDDLSLEVDYIDIDGLTKTLALRATDNGPTEPQEICLPNSRDVDYLERDTLVAHFRMCTMLCGFVAGTTELLDWFAETGSDANLQTAVGDVKVSDIRPVDDQCFDADFQKGNNPPVATHRINYLEVQRYVWAPSTQLKVIAGAVEKQFSSYIHDHPSKQLTQSQKDDIVNYVLGLTLFV